MKLLGDDTLKVAIETDLSTTMPQEWRSSTKPTPRLGELRGLNGYL